MKRSPKKVQSILTRDNFECRYCGTALNESTIRLDHVHPKSKGGSNREDNLVASCSRCNGLKWDFPLEVFLERIEAKFSACRADLEYYKAILERAGTV